MKNKRNIILAAALLGGLLTASAQDVTVLHMKNGATRHYPNGIKNMTTVNFWEFQPDTVSNQTTSNHDDGFVADWDVNTVLHQDKQYGVSIFWFEDVPDNFQATHGICFGTKPGLSLQACDTVMTVPDNRYNGAKCHYAVIGPQQFMGMWSVTVDGGKISLGAVNANWLVKTLEIGQTYYYRTFAEGRVEENGVEKTVCFYGPEKSFRVPVVMADEDYYPIVRATTEACADFSTRCLQGASVTWEEIEPLWNKWRATEEGSKVDLAADITTKQFEDGTGYRLNRIPDEFYTWLANREVVIDVFDDLKEIQYTLNSQNGDTVYYANEDRVTNVDAKWGVPNGKYIRFSPATAYKSNFDVTYQSRELIPGVSYQLKVSFAPETLLEKTDATANDFLPTIIRATAISGKKSQNVPNWTVSAEEVTMMTYDGYVPQAIGVDLKFMTRVSSSQFANGGYNRIMRIAEIQFIPMKEE